MQILIVEDDFISRRLVCRYLEPFGKCDVAINGDEAIAAVRHTLDLGDRYDLICLDIMMPGRSGLETLAEIRKLEEDYGLPLGQGAKVIMTTAMEDRANVRAAFKASADGYIVKPIEKRKFLAKLQEIGLSVETPQ